MIDIRKNLEDQALVIYSYEMEGMTGLHHGHSFIGKDIEDVQEWLTTYFEKVNMIAKKEGVPERIKNVTLIGTWELIERSSKDEKKNRKTYQKSQKVLQKHSQPSA